MLNYKKYATGYPNKSNAEMVEYIKSHLTEGVEGYIRQHYYACKNILERLHRHEERFIHLDFLEVKIAYSRYKKLTFGNMESGAHGPYDLDLYAQLYHSLFGTFP